MQMLTHGNCLYHWGWKFLFLIVNIVNRIFLSMDWNGFSLWIQYYTVQFIGIVLALGSPSWNLFVIFIGFTHAIIRNKIINWFLYVMFFLMFFIPSFICSHITHPNCLKGWNIIWSTNKENYLFSVVLKNPNKSHWACDLIKVYVATGA